MSPTWREVWDRRQLDPSLGSTLAQLMAADGLDTGFGSVTEIAWRAFVDHVACTLDLRAGTRVFEAGCGAGAFLYPLYDAGCTVAGLDRSPALVSYAAQAMPGGQFTVGDAATINPAESFDVVLSCGVFLYFPSLDYARTVVERMTTKATRAVAILDVPDLARQAQAMALRRGTLGEAAYEEKYRGLDHLYYEKTWLVDVLRACGLSRTHVEDQAIPGYANAAYRFNVFGWKE
ncbi:MAG: class I SAM-dependent methyltransferase [Acidobacteriota bacterium]|nr:class I SAM-dependent methyltransferase [Acidobacteriota bacterium]